MTQPIVAADPPHGSIEAFAAIIRSRPDVERYLEGRGIAVIQALVDDRHATPAEKVDRIHNALAAVRKVGAELAGQLYSREPAEADDPTPVSPAQGGAPHVVAVTNGGMVDETPADIDAAHAEALDEDNERAKAAVESAMTWEDYGRVANPNLARFLAEREDRRRVARHFLGLEESAKRGQPVSESR